MKNMLICGDNLKILDDLNKQGIQIDLIYLDPPFFSKKEYEIVWGDEAEVRSFEDRWAGGINVYIEWMKERMVKMYDILKDTGSLYLHCDWHANHHLRVMLDEIFEPHNFQNEIVWSYGLGGSPGNKRFIRKHDTILLYSKSGKYTFNMQYRKREVGRGTKYCHLDGKGWYMMTYGKKFYPTGEGKKMDDVWHIPTISATAKERLGYPTQKPEALLARIIKASSNEGDVILDPFCGCGTAVAVAQQLNRKWVGIDISPTAMRLIERRLERLGIAKDRDYDSEGTPKTISGLKTLKHFEFQNWVINEMQAKQSKRRTSDMGLDGYIRGHLEYKDAGIQVKQSEKVGRNVVDNFETALRRGDYKRGYVIGFSFTRGIHEEVARERKEGSDIRLVKAEDILLGEVKFFMRHE